MKPVTRHITTLQRAQISASKRFNKETEKDKWDRWVIKYQALLDAAILPAQEEGQYIRIRPKDIDENGDLILPNVEEQAS
jgi:hypothetical protein